MADLKQVYIDQFPELTGLLSSDKIIAFERVDEEDYRPIVLEVGDLSAFFVGKEYVDVLSAKIAEMESKVDEVEKHFEKILPKDDDLTDYATIGKLETELSKLEKTSDFNAKLNGKADKTFLNAQYNSLLGKLQHLKATYSGAGHDAGKKWESNREYAGYPYKTVLAALAKQAASGGVEDNTEE